MENDKRDPWGMNIDEVHIYKDLDDLEIILNSKKKEKKSNSKTKK